MIPGTTSFSLSLGFVIIALTQPAFALSPSSTISYEQHRLLQEALKADKASMTKSTASRSAVGQFASNQSMNPDISFILDVAMAWFSDAKPLQLGAHDPNQIGFTFQQLEAHIESRVDPYFDFQANLVFSLFGVELEEAYAQTLALSGGFKIKVGQFLLPFGRINPTHPHTWAFLDQALIIGKFMGGEGGRGLGLEVSWLAPLPWYLNLILATTLPAGECCSRSFIGEHKEPVNGMEDFLYLGRAEQFWELNDNWSLLLGLSYLFGENKTGLNNHSALTSADLLLRYRPLHSTDQQSLSVQAEWTHRTRQLPERVLKDHGGYVHTILQCNPHWSMGARLEWVDGVQQDPQDPTWSKPRIRSEAQITWHPSHFSRLRFQIGRDHPTWRNDPIWSAIVGVEVLVGAHSAHTY